MCVCILYMARLVFVLMALLKCLKSSMPRDQLITQLMTAEHKDLTFILILGKSSTEMSSSKSLDNKNEEK